MNKGFFWVVFLALIFNGYASYNPIINPDLIDVWQKIEQHKKQSYVSRINEEINKFSMYCVIGGFILGHSYGSLLDRVFGLTKDSGCVDTAAIFGAFIGFSAVQVTSIFFLDEQNR